MDETQTIQCALAGQCGGCSQIGVPYADQLAAKQAYVEGLFAKLQWLQGAELQGAGIPVPISQEGATPVPIIRPILGMENPIRYRNKIVSPFAPARAQGRKPSLRSMARTGRAGKVALRKSDIACGLYAAGTHKLIECSDCPIEHAVGRRVVAAVRDIMARYGVAPYNEDAGTGFMRHVVVRVGAHSGEVLVTLVTNGAEFTGAKNFCRELKKRVPEITSIVQNINTRQTNVIFGEDERTLYGPGFILDTLCGLSFRISSHSFYQTNALQTEVLYRTAINYSAALTSSGIVDAAASAGTQSAAFCESSPTEVGFASASGTILGTSETLADSSTACDPSTTCDYKGFGGSSTTDAPLLGQEPSCASLLHASKEIASQSNRNGVQTVVPEPPNSSTTCGSLHACGSSPLTILDAYCGAGTIGLVAAAAAPGAQVIGVDSVSAAIDDARQNAAHNGIENARFVCEDAGFFMREYAKTGNVVDVVFMDPPRAGASEEFLHALAQLAPGRVVYISCNPETQVRDCKVLMDAGYSLAAVQPVDMFPHTNHVECVSLLVRTDV